MDGWDVKSNAESGEGYSDISVEIEDKEIGIVIEFKYAEHASFDAGCKEALKQIRDRNYEKALVEDGMKANFFLAFSVSFWYDINVALKNV